MCLDHRENGAGIVAQKKGLLCMYILIAKVHYVEGPLAVYSTPACVAGVYLLSFFIGNLSYTPGSEPSRTVLLLDVMYCTQRIPTTGV